MKNLFLLIALAIVTSSASSQTCMGDFFFEQQSEIDQFLIDHPSCTSIEGSVTISIWLNADPILNVDGLQNIAEINGMLEITNGNDAPAPTLLGLSNLVSVDSIYISSGVDDFSLDGLNNLQNVSSLYVNAYYITDLHAFDGITHLDDLTLDFMWDVTEGAPPSFYDVFPALQTVTNGLIIGKSWSACGTLTGLNSLISVGSLSFSYWDQFMMDAFDGMHNLQTIDGGFYNYAWVANAVSGFENVESIGYAEMSLDCACDMPDFASLNSIGDLWLFNYVNTLPDFPSLITIPGDLLIMGDAQSIGLVSLEEVNGYINIAPDASGTAYFFDEIHMDSLRQVGGSLTIAGTDIDNIDFLSNLESVGGTFGLYYNVNLSNCEVEYLCQQIPLLPDMFQIEQNAPGCNSNDEVLTTCGDSYVLGGVYYDLDCDGVFNNADVVLQNPVLFNNINQPIGSSNYQGEFFVPLQDNTTTTITVGNLPGYSTTPQTFTTTNTSQVFNGVQFGMCPQANLHDVSVSLFAPVQVRPSHYVTYYFTVHNQAPTIEHVTANFSLSDMPGMTYVNSNPAGNLSGNSVSWDFPAVPGLGTQFYSLTLYADISIAVGSMVTFDMQVDVFPNPNDDIFPTDNHLTYTQTVVNSYDPNDITVNIPAYNHDHLTPAAGLSLDYTIRFQNTGTAEAINVRVLDEIEEDLDLTSFEMIGSSHPCTLTFNENNQVEWLFENIMLPDSTSNEEESHGYIQYRIKTQPNLLLEDVIENTAAIYFDFNEPVITNTATTVFYVCPEELIIDSEPTVCAGASVNAIATYGWDDYSWSVNDIQNGNGLGISLDNLTSGIYSIVCNANTEYCEASSYFELMVIETPETPIISQVGNTLTATGSGTFEWTLNGETFIDGANSIEINSTGNYAVSVTSNGCTSETTSGEYVYIGIDEAETKGGVSIIPNPMAESCNVILENVPLQNTSLHVINALGELVAQINVVSKITSLSHLELNSGVYFISIQQDGELMVPTMKLVVQK